MYSHMPFFLNENFGVFCVANKYSYCNNIPFKPWKLVEGNLKVYNHTDFDIEPEYPSSVHCSPVLINNILSVSCNRSLYVKKNKYSKWEKIKDGIWQGFYDGKNINYAKDDFCYIENTEIDFPFFKKIIRIVPYKTGYIITGMKNNYIDYGTIYYENNKVSEIKTSDGMSLYKCNISDDNILFYSDKFFNVNERWENESYKIKTTKDFYFDENSDIFK